MNLATGVTLVTSPVSSLAWTIGAGAPNSPTFINGLIRPANILPNYNSLVHSGGYGAAGFSHMSFDLTGIAVVGDGSNFFSSSNVSNMMAMQISAFGDSAFSQWLGTGIAMSGTMNSLASPNPAPPSLVLLASGAMTGLSGLAIRRRKVA